MERISKLLMIAFMAICVCSCNKDDDEGYPLLGDPCRVTGITIKVVNKNGENLLDKQTPGYIDPTNISIRDLASSDFRYPLGAYENDTLFDCLMDTGRCVITSRVYCERILDGKKNYCDSLNIFHCIQLDDDSLSFGNFVPNWLGLVNATNERLGNVLMWGGFLMESVWDVPFEISWGDGTKDTVMINTERIIGKKVYVKSGWYTDDTLKTQCYLNGKECDNPIVIVK